MKLVVHSNLKGAMERMHCEALREGTDVWRIIGQRLGKGFSLAALTRDLLRLFINSSHLDYTFLGLGL